MAETLWQRIKDENNNFSKLVYNKITDFYDKGKGFVNS